MGFNVKKKEQPSSSNSQFVFCLRLALLAMIAFGVYHPACAFMIFGLRLREWPYDLITAFFLISVISWLVSIAWSLIHLFLVCLACDSARRAEYAIWSLAGAAICLTSITTNAPFLKEFVAG